MFLLHPVAKSRLMPMLALNYWVNVVFQTTLVFVTSKLTFFCSLFFPWSSPCSRLPLNLVSTLVRAGKSFSIPSFCLKSPVNLLELSALWARWAPLHKCRPDFSLHFTAPSRIHTAMKLLLELEKYNTWLARIYISECLSLLTDTRVSSGYFMQKMGRRCLTPKLLSAPKR